MTREHAIQCRDYLITVEDRNDEDLKTGIVVEIVNAALCIVHWDDVEGTKTIGSMRDLVVQYPEDIDREAARTA